MVYAAISTPVRRCCGCGTRLARDNASARCSPCARIHRQYSGEAPEMDPDFWRADQMRDAFASKEMSLVVRSYRHHPAHGRRPLPQVDMARWLGITQGQLSRIESGRNRIRDLDKL